MRTLVTSAFIGVALSQCSAQVGIMAGAGYSARLTDTRATNDYAYTAGATWSDTLCGRWMYEAGLTFTRKGERPNTVTSDHVDAVGAHAFASWRTDKGDTGPLLAIGIFGSRDLASPRYGVGPLGGVGLRWPRGRLLLHYQQALDGLKATDGALMATVSIRVL